MQLTSKRILVTGATGGIGSVLCRQLAAQGARLLMNGIDAARLTELHNELGKQHETVLADISTQDGRDAIEQACLQSGGTDAVINLAGILNFNLFVQQDPGLISKMLQVNTLSPILLSRQLLPHLLTRGEARILNVGSIFGSIGHPGFSVYCASKAAVKTFSEALARELADTKVSVAYIAPRATRTALNSDRVRALNVELGSTEDPPELVAHEICALLANEKRIRFLGWPEKLFVMINAVLPSLVHRALVGKLAVIKKFASGTP